MWCFKKKQPQHRALEENMVFTEQWNRSLLTEVKRLKQERIHMLKAHADETQHLKQEVSRLENQNSALMRDFLQSTFTFRTELNTTSANFQHTLQQQTAELQEAKAEVRTLTEACARSVDLNNNFSNLVGTLREEKQAVSKALELERHLKDSYVADAQQYIMELQTRVQEQEVQLRREIDKFASEKKKQQEESHDRTLKALSDANKQLEEFNQRIQIEGRMNSRLFDENDDIEEEPGLHLREEMEEDLMKAWAQWDQTLYDKPREPPQN